jgi:hypothetical protein
MKKSLLIRCYRIAKKLNNIDKHPQFDCYKHFTAIIQNGKIIEIGLNHAGTPDIKFYQPWQKVHAEYLAFKKAKGILNLNDSFDVVNIRLDKRGNLKISKPCKCCMNYITMFSKKPVFFYFSNEIGGFSKIIL